MIATTRDGVEVEVSTFGRHVYVRVMNGDYWRETDRTSVEAAALWVSRLTWSEVRLSCL